MKREIESMLVISTKHIPQSDSEMLTKEGFITDYPIKMNKGKLFRDPILIVILYEEGYIIYVAPPPFPWEACDKFDEHYSETLKKLMRLALENECKYLKLDRDGYEYEDLETFNW